MQHIVGHRPDAEVAVLVTVARRSLSPSQFEALRHQLRRITDWDRLMRLAAHHRLSPLLYWHLREQRAAVPAAVLDRLERSFLANVQRNLALTAELLSLAGELDSQQIPFLPYKGPALAAEAYGNLALRVAVDLDIVVRRRDLARIRAILRSRDYSAEHRLDAAGEQRMERTLYHEAFYRADGCAVEVHWAFTDKQRGFSLDLEALEPRLQTVPIGGYEVRSFAREDLLLVLSVHGAKHRWERLELSATVAELLRGSPELDWETLETRALGLGSRRVLHLALLLASDLFDAPVPSPLRARIRADRTVARLAAMAKRLLFEDPADGEPAGLLPRDVFYLQLNDRVADKLRFLMHRLTTPSQAKNWNGYRFGRLYLPLHALTRPFAAWRRLVPAARWLATSRRDAS